MADRPNRVSPWSRLRRAVVGPVSLGLVASLGAGLAPPASAADGTPDAEVVAAKAFLDEVAAWSSTLGSAGRMAEPLPVVGSSIGGVLGIGDLIADEVAAAIPADVDEFHQLVGPGGLGGAQFTAPDSGDGRSSTVTVRAVPADGGEDARVEIDATVLVEAQDAGLSVVSEEPRLSLASTGGLDVTATARVSFVIGVEQVGADLEPYLVAGPAAEGGFGLDATAEVTLPDGEALEAAFGILEVELTEAVPGETDPDVRVSIATAIDDPDGDGRLRFTEPDGSIGELSAETGAAPLATVGFPAGGEAGYVDLDVRIAARADTGFDLPAVDATVSVTWDDVAAGTPDISATGLAGLEGFLAVSPRDLADMLAQAATAVTAATLNQPADLDLPFLSGTLADAVLASELLVGFLSDAVTQPVLGTDGTPLPVQPDPAAVGRPDFVSIQQLVEQLEAYDAGGTLGDAGIDVTVGDLVDDRLPLTLALTRAATGPVDLAPAGDRVSGPGSYAVEPTTGVGLVTAAEGSPFTEDTVGRRVVAGGSGGTVQQVSADGTTAVLTAAWSGGVPAAGTVFVLEGAQPQAGVVRLANLIGADDAALRGANGIVPTARVTPDYSLELRLALDLSAPRTGGDCTDGPGGAPCPYARDNSDGSTTVISEEPVAVERLLFGTGYDLLTADFPIEADVDVAAKAGFLKVDVAGDIGVQRGPGAQPMLSIGIAAVDGYPGGWVPTTEFFPLLADPESDLLTGSTNIGASVSGSVSVPDASDFLPGGASAGFDAQWAQVGVGEPVVTVDDLSQILAFDLDPDNPAALLGLVLQVLQLLDSELQAGGGGSVLGTDIPLVDTSLGDLLGQDTGGGGPAVTFDVATVEDSFVSEPAADGSTSLATTPVDKVVLQDSSRTGDRAFTDDLVGRAIVVGTQVGVVQDVLDDQRLLLASVVSLTDATGMPAMFAGTLSGVPAAGTSYTLRSELADAVSLLTADPPDSLQELVALLDARLGEDSPVSFRSQVVGGVPALVLGLEWAKDYSTSTPVTLDLGTADLVGARSSGRAELAVEADLDLDVALPLVLAGPGGVDLRLLDSSRVRVEVDAALEGDIEANLGPLSLSLGLPDDVDGGDEVDAVARARYSVAFGAPATADDAGRSLTGFLGAAAVSVNDYEGGVDCGEADADTDVPLALCANLPLYISADGESWSPTLEPISVRLPKGSGAVIDLATLVDLTGTVGGTDPRLRLQAPSGADLEAAFLDALLDFGVLGEGIDAFLALIENALAEASLEGRLPVIGDDLQAGADVIGDIRTGVAQVFEAVEGVNGGKLPDVQAVNDLVLQPLEDLFVDELGAAADSFVFEFTCRLQPADVTDAVVGGGGEDGTTGYTYAVQAIGTLGGNEVRTVLGQTDDAVVTTLGTGDGDNSVTVSWTGVSNATGYALLRSDDGGAGWTEVGVTAATSLVDTGQVTGEAVTLVGAPANVDACDGVQLPDVEGVLFRVDLGDGEVSAEAGCVEGSGCLEAAVPLDVGVPGLAVRAQRDGRGGTLAARVGWQAHLAFELDRTFGLSVLTQDTDTAEFGLGFAVDLTDGISAELAFLAIDVTKADPDGAPAVSGAVQVDLAAPGDGSCFGAGEDACTVDGSKRVGLGELFAQADEVVRPNLSLSLAVNWQLAATVDAALPGLQARLVMTWGIDGADPGAVTAEALAIAFEDIAIDAGGFLSGVLGPIVTELQRVTGPLQPIIDTIYAPIPVLSDLSKLVGGGDISIVTLAKTFSTLLGGPNLDFVDTIAAVITFVNNLPVADEGEALLIPVGSFTVGGEAAFATALTPDTAGSLVSGPAPTGADLRQAIDAVSSQKDAAGGDRPSTALSGGSSSEATASGAGIEIPLLDNPSLLFTLIMGGDVDLVTFDSGELSLGFTWRQSFGPVYAPPPVMVTLSGSAKVTARIQAGFDTYGLRKAFEQELSVGSVAGILNGLYFRSTDDAGAPLPVLTFYGEIAAGAAVSAVIIEVGIQGGVSLTIAFSWNDPDKDGKFRLFEFGQAALNNPICLFQVSGRIGLFLKVYITIGVSIFSVSFDFTLADITLLDFSVAPDCSPPPPRLGATSADGTTLVLFAGKFGTGAVRGDGVYDNADKDERFVVTAVHDYSTDTPTFRGVQVSGLGITESWLDGDYADLSRVVFDGRGLQSAMELTFLGDGEPDTDTSSTGAASTSEFALDTVVIGGPGPDTIKTGTGSAWIDGQGGADVITTGEAEGETVWIAGGTGDDSITTGAGTFVVAGDSTLNPNGVGAAWPERTLEEAELARNGGGLVTTSVSGVVDWSALVVPTGSESGAPQGADRISVGRGGGTVYGNGGDDSLAVASDDPRATAEGPAAFRAEPVTIVGGTGADSIKGGSAADTIWTGPQTGAERGVLDGEHGVDADGAADGGALRNAVETGGGADTVFGSDAPDYVTVTPVVGYDGSLPAAHVRLGAGDDVVTGGLGSDELFGGPGDDWVVAGPADVSDAQGNDDFGVVRTYERLPLPAGVAPQPNLLVGGDGADRVLGGEAASVLFGDRYEFTLAGGVYTTVACGDVVLEPFSAAPAEPEEGSPGRDEILGGSGADRVSAGGAADRVRTFDGDDVVCGQGGDDDIGTGTGDDTVWAGSGDDLVRAGAGADEVFGNSGDDVVHGDDGDDTVEGNEGDDTLFGGAGADLLVGGHRWPGLPDGSDTVFGGAGADVVVGDNAKAIDDGPRGPTWYPDDLDGLTPTAGARDVLSGGDGRDEVYGGLGDDDVRGDAGDDYLEGNNGDDTVSGGSGEDVLVGGSREEAAAGTGRPDGADVLSGGAGADLVLGDNARVDELGAAGADGESDVLAGRGFARAYALERLDLGFAPEPGTSARDLIDGGDGDDALFGQGGPDEVRGGAGDDLLEGGPDADLLYGGTGDDDIVGGSSVPLGSDTGGHPSGQPDTGDRVYAGAGEDLVLGDNGRILRGGGTHPLLVGRLATARDLVLLDLGDDPLAGASGDDYVDAGSDDDVVLAQGGDDHVVGGPGDDYVEGGPGSDLLRGQAGDDDLVGGSYTPYSGTGAATTGQPDGGDLLRGGTGDDVLLGDNGAVLRGGATDRVLQRLGSAGAPLTGRQVVRYDLLAAGDTADETRFGADTLAGGDGVDVAWGQSGDDMVSGGSGDDALFGNAGDDVLRGDAAPEVPSDRFDHAPSWPLWPGDGDGVEVDAAALTAVATDDGDGSQPDGDDDLVGGSAVRGAADGDDVIEGNGGDDVVLADNGGVVRALTADGTAERVMVERLPHKSTVLRLPDATIGLTGPESSRYCVDDRVRGTCEVPGAYGDDAVYGDAGDDQLWGQDGDDVVRGGAGDDEIYGETGDDRLFGDSGRDVILGDRGGVLSRVVTTDGPLAELSSVPKESYLAVPAGSYDRRVDHRNDVVDGAFVGASTTTTMPLPGDEVGGDDRIRGGDGDDVIFAGAGDDLANGDSGGDDVFGDDGADVLWGGKGCAGCSDPGERGEDDEFVDRLFGGAGGDVDNGFLGADVMDWRPRGSYPDNCSELDFPTEVGRGKTATSIDPCSWFEMTGLTGEEDDESLVNQHHQGTDWMYGGWGRDVMQADLAANGPNPGDRLIDWNGAYNLYSHCNAAYGGFNDVRQHSPAMQEFLQVLAYGSGAGQGPGDAATEGTSAFRSLSLAYPGDREQSSGRAFPGTPGHFDDPNACAP